MPKTAVYEDDFTMSRQHQVGLTREIFAVESKTIAERVDNLANYYFRLSVLTSNARHDHATFGWTKYIRHLILRVSESLEAHGAE